MATDAGAGQSRKAASPREEEQVEHAAPNAEVAERGEELKDELDSLLDEIDNVLEENAEEFVKQYVQKGGQ